MSDIVIFYCGGLMAEFVFQEFMCRHWSMYANTIKYADKFNIQLNITITALSSIFYQSYKQKTPGETAMIIIPSPHRGSFKPPYPVPPPAPPCAPSKYILNYTIDYEQALGRGNFSTVYKCTKLGQSEKYYAVKLINLGSLRMQKIEHLVWAEIDILKGISNRNVIGARDVYWTEEWCYIFCDFFEGGNLEERLKKVKVMRETPQALAMIRNIFEGLTYLEKSKIIHRDIKPANIFLKDDQAIVADLGFAKIFNEPFYDLQIGSPPYMAPQSLSMGYYSNKSDVWSFGVMLYEIFHGEGPFIGCLDMKQLIQKVKTPLSFISLKSDLSIEMKQFIMSCLEVDLEKRPKFSEIQDSWYYKKLFQQKRPESILRSPLNTIKINENCGPKGGNGDKSPVFTRLNKLKSDIKKKKDQNSVFSTINQFEIITTTPQKIHTTRQTSEKNQYYSYIKSSRTLKTQDNQQDQSPIYLTTQFFSSQVSQDIHFINLKPKKNNSFQPPSLHKFRYLPETPKDSNLSPLPLRNSIKENLSRISRRQYGMQNKVAYTFGRQKP